MKKAKAFRKEYDLKGFVCFIKTMEMAKDTFVVNVTKDERGCTLSVALEPAQVQFTIPLDEVLKDLKNED